MSCCSEVKVCLKYDYQFVDELVYNLKKLLQSLASKKLSHLFYGYNCEVDIDEKINKTTILINSLERIKLSFLHIQKYCLPEDRIQLIIEKAIKLVGKVSCPESRYDIVVDDSAVYDYLLAGNSCASYDTWNKFSRLICGKLDFKLTLEKDICDITFDIVKKVISCNLLYALQLRKEFCDLGYKIKKDNDECKLEYKLLRSNYPNCDLEYKVYTDLVNKHNISYPIFKEVYEGGLTLIKKENDVFICTPLNQYNIKDITANTIEELLNNGYLLTLNKDDIKIDFKK